MYANSLKWVYFFSGHFLGTFFSSCTRYSLIILSWINGFPYLSDKWDTQKLTMTAASCSSYFCEEICCANMPVGNCLILLSIAVLNKEVLSLIILTQRCVSLARVCSDCVRHTMPCHGTQYQIIHTTVSSNYNTFLYYNTNYHTLFFFWYNGRATGDGKKSLGMSTHVLLKRQYGGCHQDWQRVAVLVVVTSSAAGVCGERQCSANPAWAARKQMGMLCSVHLYLWARKL